MMLLPVRKPEIARGTAQSVGGRMRRRAVAAAEFAVLAPFLFWLMIGMFELARGIMIKQMLNDAARKACRTAIQRGMTNTDVNNELKDIFTDNNIPFSDGQVTIQVGPESSPPLSVTSTDITTARPGLDFVLIKIGIPVSDVNWAATYFLSGSVVESETVVMLKQG